MKKNVRNILSAALVLVLLAVVLIVPAAAEGTAATTVNDATELRAAVEAGGDIILGANIDIGQGAVEVSTTVTLDLNGKELTCPNDTAGDGVFHVVAGGDLTINGEGTINSVGNNDYSMAIWADGGKVTINGGTYTNEGCTKDESDNSHYDLIYVKKGSSVSIHGGTFICETPKWTLNSHDSSTGTFEVHGGVFIGYDPRNADTEPKGPISWVAAGSTCTAVGSTYSVTGVAAIGNAQYATLQAALNAAKDNETVTLFGDYTQKTALTINSGNVFTLDLNDCTLTLTGGDHMIKNGTNLTISNGKLVMDNASTNANALINISGYSPVTSKLTLDKVTFNAKDYSSAFGVLYTYTAGALEIKDSVLNFENEGYAAGGAIKADGDNCNITITNSKLNFINSVRGFSNGDVSITGSEVMITGDGTSATLDNGINSVKMTVTDSTITIDGCGDRALTLDSENVTIVNSTLNLGTGSASLRFKSGAGKLILDNGAVINLTNDADKLIVLDVATEVPSDRIVAAEGALMEIGEAAEGKQLIHCHEYIMHEQKDATCTEAGNVEYFTCQHCDSIKIIENDVGVDATLEDTVIPAKDHTLANVESKPATCTEDGNEEYWYCEVCSGDKIYADKELTTETTLEKVTIPAGHNYTSRVDAKAATCTETGNVEYWACEHCDVVEIVTENGRVESTQEKTVIAAKGHTMTKVETKTPSCTDDGNVEYYNCSVCKKNFADEKGEKELTTVVEAAKGHKLTKVEAKDATCTAAGNIEHYSCDGCKKLFIDAEGKTETTAEKVAVAAKGHTEVAVAGKAATCTETGLTEGKKCSVCGTVTVAQKTIDALGHKLTKVEAKAATYTEAGNIEHYACACGKLFADDKGEKEITDVVIPQLIKVEEEKAEVSKDAVDNAIADAKEKAEETGKPVEVIIEVPKAPVVEKPDDSEGEDTTKPEEKPEEKPQEVVKVELPVEALENVAKEEANLTVVMPSVTVTVDTDALKAVTEQAAGNTVTLVVEQVKEETLTEKQQEAVKQYDVAVTIKAEFICQETNEKIWTEDNNADEESSGSVTVKMPFTPAEGSKGSDYKVLYIADDGSVKAIDTAFVDGHLVFALEHFSEYVVVNTKTTSQTPNTGDNAMLTPVALLLTLSFAGMAVMVAGKKKLL